MSTDTAAPPFDRPAWLLTLKTGDTVIVEDGQNRWSTGKVTRAMIKYVTVKDNNYSRRDGFRTGDGWNTGRIHPATPENMERTQADIRRRRALADVHCIEWNDVATERIQRVLAVVRGEEEGNKAP